MATGIVNVAQGLEDFLGIGQSSARGQNEINREFQERMSNTAYQRGMEDMKKAGLNPLLMMNGSSSASTPSGSSGFQGANTAKAMMGVVNMIANVAMANSKAMITQSYSLRDLLGTTSKFMNDDEGKG